MQEIPAGAIKVRDKKSDAAAALFGSPSGPCAALFIGGRVTGIHTYIDERAREASVWSEFVLRRYVMKQRRMQIQEDFEYFAAMATKPDRRNWFRRLLSLG